MSEPVTIPSRITELVIQHGSLTAVALVLKTDKGYLHRLWYGERENPSPTILKRMGLRKVVTFERV